jgi:uncharacterized RDD family membrane protein YckC
MKNRYLIRRFFAFNFDLVIISVLLLISLYTYHILIYSISIDDLSFIMIMILNNLLAFCYFVFSDFFFGKSLGKKIFQLKINGFEQKNKAKLLKQVIIRNLFRFVPFDQLSILFYEDYRMWHDIVSITTVASLTVM